MTAMKSCALFASVDQLNSRLPLGNKNGRNPHEGRQHHELRSARSAAVTADRPVTAMARSGYVAAS